MFRNIFILEVKKLDIYKIVYRYVAKEEVIFINTNLGNGSYDVDIYCVKKTGNSETHCFVCNEGTWIELFIDSLDNAEYKIETIDSLGMNYIYMLPFYDGDQKIHDKLCQEIEKHRCKYSLYDLDRKLFIYRVRISYEKINSSNHEWSNRNLCCALVYPFISYLLGKYHVFPLSPKNWLQQLENVMGKDFQDLECLFDGSFNYEEIGRIIEKYIPPLSSIDLVYHGMNRRSRVE